MRIPRHVSQVVIGLALLGTLVVGYGLVRGIGPEQALAGAGGTPAELVAIPGAEDIVARRVWAGDSVDVLGRPSPDGRWLSYVDWIGGGNLAVRDLRTGERRLLTKKDDGWATDEHALFSVFSPDGSHLAHQWWNTETSEYEIRVADVDGESVRTLYAPGNTQRYVQPVAWSRHGDRLLVIHSAEDRTWQIGFMDAADGQLTIVRSLDWRVPRALDLSPDGRWIAYSLPREDRPEVQDIFLLAADGSEERRLVASDASEVVVGWLPGGGPLFYLSERDAGARLLAQELEGARPVGEPRVVRSDLLLATAMGAFRDGFLFSVAVDANQTRAAGIDLDGARLTSPLGPVVQARMERAVAPEWSRDGEHLVYVVNPPLGGLSFPVNMAIRSARTGAERRFATPFGYVNNIALSPDGTELLVQGYGPQARNGIYRMPVGGEEVVPVERNGIDADQVRIPFFSADGASAYYVRWNQSDDEERIVRRHLTSGAVDELYRTARLRSFAVSPDESELAVVRPRPDEPEEFQLLVVDLESGDVRELVRTALPAGFPNGSHVTWSPDGEHVLYVWRGLDPPDRPTLHVISRLGGEPRAIETDMPVTRPRLHPDGRRIAVQAGENRWEVWTLENVRAVVEKEER